MLLFQLSQVADELSSHKQLIKGRLEQLKLYMNHWKLPKRVGLCTIAILQLSLNRNVLACRCFMPTVEEMSIVRVYPCHAKCTSLNVTAPPQCVAMTLAKFHHVKICQIMGCSYVGKCGYVHTSKQTHHVHTSVVKFFC